MSSIVRLSGFSAEVLRAWERRYGILRPQRGPGGHRLYTDDDLRVLARIRELIAERRSIGEIVLNGRDVLLRDAARDPLPVERAAPGMAELDACREALVTAAVSIDRTRVEQALDRAFSLVSPETVLSAVIEPASRKIGELWEQGKCTVAGEHLVSSVLQVHLSRLLQNAAGLRRGGPKAVAACLPDEWHEVGSVAVAFYLARAGFDVSYLGGALPFEDLDKACATLSPQLVCLSVTRRVTLELSRPELIGFLSRRHNDVTIALGGLGVPEADDELTAAGAVLWPASRPIDGLLDLPLLHSSSAWQTVKE